jgi:hypothetical protein
MYPLFPGVHLSSLSLAPAAQASPCWAVMHWPEKRPVAQPGLPVPAWFPPPSLSISSGQPNSTSQIRSPKKDGSSAGALAQAARIDGGMPPSNINEQDSSDKDGTCKQRTELCCGFYVELHMHQLNALMSEQINIRRAASSFLPSFSLPPPPSAAMLWPSGFTPGLPVSLILLIHFPAFHVAY